jgi:thiosulfate/3-mercaptopyruvate sulfurtransferase
MKVLKIVSLFVFSIFFIQAALAEDPEFKSLVNVKELASLMKNDNVVVVSARKPSNYAKVHVNGSVNVYYRDLKQEGDMGLMKSVDEITKYLGDKGICETNHVVIYDDGKMKAATRVYWIMKYVGVKKVSILDGGVEAWKAGRKPVTATPTNLKQVLFKADLDESINITLSDFMAKYDAENVALIDAREIEYFNGEKGKNTRPGHIPNAINIDYNEVLKDGFFKSKEEIEKLIAGVGISKDQQVIVYCNSGVKAAVIYFALTEICGYENIRLFEGSFNEWEADTGNPVI